MPANFSRSLKPLVRLKDGKLCSLKRHFKGCMRQVVGYLDLLASKDPDRLVWATAKNIQLHCPTGKGKELYGIRMVERALQAARDTGILSRQHAIELQERRGFIVGSAYVVAPHEALTVQNGTCCRFVGACAVPGTHWGFGGGDKWFISADGKKSEVQPQIVFTPGPGALELAKKEKL